MQLPPNSFFPLYLKSVRPHKSSSLGMKRMGEARSTAQSSTEKEGCHATMEILVLNSANSWCVLFRHMMLWSCWALSVFRKLFGKSNWTLGIWCFVMVTSLLCAWRASTWSKQNISVMYYLIPRMQDKWKIQNGDPLRQMYSYKSSRKVTYDWFLDRNWVREGLVQGLTMIISRITGVLIIRHCCK